MKVLRKTRINHATNCLCSQQRTGCALSSRSLPLWILCAHLQHPNAKPHHHQLKRNYRQPFERHKTDGDATVATCKDFSALPWMTLNWKGTDGGTKMKCTLRKWNGRTGEERQKMKCRMYSQKSENERTAEWTDSWGNTNVVISKVDHLNVAII